MSASENHGSRNMRKSNNYVRANPISKLLFWWMIPTFWRGAKNELSLDDLSLMQGTYGSHDLGYKLERAWFTEIARVKDTQQQPSLMKAILKTFFIQNISSAILLFISSGILRVLSPKMLANMLRYWDTNNSKVAQGSAMMYATLLVVITFSISILQQHALRLNQEHGMTIRVACSTLIYRKVLRMDMSSLGGAATGQVVNLMANDVARFDNLLISIHYLWVGPLQIIISCCLMYNDVGWITFLGMLALILQTLPTQLYISKLIAKFRFLIAQRTDERVRIMNEIISGVEVIKMYAWETPFEKIVSDSRRAEIKMIMKSFYVRAVNNGCMIFTERISLFVIILALYIHGDPIIASMVFSLAQYFNILKLTFALHIPTAVLSMAETDITVKRIQNFLMSREREDLSAMTKLHYLKNLSGKKDECEIKVISQNSKTKSQKTSNGIVNNLYVDNVLENDDVENGELNGLSEFTIEVNEVTARWNEQRLTPTLDTITMNIEHGKLCIIIGAVGAGKSSLLQLLLGEMRPSVGSVRINEKLSYASQEPWLFVNSIRENILFGLPYEEDKYKTVISVCALQDDFHHFPYGDQSLVGERGISLSGGQRARVNLARAIYREANIYLLDDPLSAVDAVVGRQLFDKCITGYLKGKTRLLVTHQLHYLKAADQIIMLNNGAIEQVGTYEDLMSSSVNFAKLLADYYEETEDKKKESILGEISVKTSSDKPEEEISKTASETLKEEEIATGDQGYELYLNYIRAGSNWMQIGMYALVLATTQVFITGTDYWITYWTNQEGVFLKDASAHSKNITNGIIATIGKYEFSDDTTIHTFDRSLYLYLYIFFLLMCVAFSIARAILCYTYCTRSSIRLHDQMFHSLLRGVMQFFRINPSGRILNRFSKDIGTLDELLPKTLIETIQTYFLIAGILILVSISLPWMLMAAVVLLVYFYLLMHVYIKSARAIKRLEGNAKSPVFSHLTSTLRGISTIRCAKSQDAFIKEFDELQDVHSSIWCQYISSSCTLGFWLDAAVSMFLTLVVYTFLLAEGLAVQAGNVGVAISQTLALNGMLPYGIKQTAEMISYMTSVERVLQYTNIEREAEPNGSAKKPDDWPRSGAISMKHTSLKYAVDKPLVLIDLNVEIEAGWKVGIVGRTGAGKTSLISALFRLATIEGKISIDDVDTSLIKLKDLRSSISIIPQEPVLYTATIRYNLDPFNIYNDVQLWEALEAVELKDAIPSLDFKVQQHGANFSVGQRQLLCLGRAILKNNKILVLDEATANVDTQTDVLIQKTIRDKFAQCTVLTIAHRLNTVMDSDRVLVMSFGKAVEFDHPFKLLNDENGVFHGMVKQMGQKTSTQLYNISKEAFLISSNLDNGDNSIGNEQD